MQGRDRSDFPRSKLIFLSTSKDSRLNSFLMEVTLRRSFNNAMIRPPKARLLTPDFLQTAFEVASSFLASCKTSFMKVVESEQIYSEIRLSKTRRRSPSGFRPGESCCCDLLSQ